MSAALKAYQRGRQAACSGADTFARMPGPLLTHMSDFSIPPAQDRQLASWKWALRCFRQPGRAQPLRILHQMRTIFGLQRKLGQKSATVAAG